MPLILDGTNGISGVDGSAGTPSYQGTDSDTGLWYPAANTVALSTGGSERMRIDSSGRVLIGTTSGTRKLTVYENAAQVDLSIVSSTTGLAVIQMGDTAADNQGQIIYRNNGDSMEFAVNGAERMRITSSGNVGIGTSSPTDSNGFGRVIDMQSSTGAAIYVRSTGAPTTGAYLGFVGSNSNAYLFNKASAPLLFGVNDGETGRFTTGGYLKVANNGNYYGPSVSSHELRNTVDGNNVVYIIHAGSAPYGPYMRFSGASPNNSTNYYMYCDDTVSARFIVNSNGNVLNSNGTYGAISDIKKKENIVDATPKLDDVMQLKVRNFNFKTDPDLKQIGFVAQEFEEVFPNMVEDTAEMGDDGKPTGETSKTIKMSVLIPILTKAIQEQQAQIEELKQEIAALKAK